MLRTVLSIPCTIAIALATSFCFADEIVESGTFDSPSLSDNGEAAVSTITIMDQGLIQDISVTINNLQHTSVGDLVAELRFVELGGGGGGNPAYLFFRPNLEPGTIGSRANVSGNYTFTTDEDDESFWSESAIPDDETVDTSLDYFASDENGEFHDLAGPQFFGAMNVQGLWQLYIRDVEDFGNNEGSVEGWTIQFHVTAIPEPSCGVLLIAILAFPALRRR